MLKLKTHSGFHDLFLNYNDVVINAQCRNGPDFFVMRYRNLRNNKKKKNQLYQV